MSPSKPVVVGLAVAVVGVAVAAFLIGPKTDKPATTPAAVIAATNAVTIEILDPTHDRPFTVSTWPATAQSNNGLIVISHGFAGDRTSHDDLAADLAAAGYTVAAPTHPDLAGLESNDRQLDPLLLRPRHISLTIDYLIDSADEPYGEIIVIGHSLGGYSALRISGASPSGSAVDQHCQDNPSDDVLCSATARTRIDDLVSARTDFTDPRVDAVVLLAPAYGPLFSADDLSHVDADVLVIEAASDNQLPGQQLEALLDALPDRTESVTVEGGHYIFLRACTHDEQSAIPELCTDADGIDRVDIHHTVESVIDRFLSQ